MRKRNIRIQVRLNEIEYEKLQNDISKGNENISDYIRKLIMNIQVKEKPDHDFLKILNQLARVGVNINQIAKKANEGGGIDKLNYEKESKELFEIVRGLKKKYL